MMKPGDPFFHLGSFVGKADGILQNAFSGNLTATIRLPDVTEATDLMITKTQFGSGFNDISVEARLYREPMILAPSRQIKSFSAAILSPPNFQNKSIRLTENDNLQFELLPLKVKNVNAYRLNAVGKIDADDVYGSLSNLLDFLTFVKGSYAGVGHVCTQADQNPQELLLFGFSQNDAHPLGDPDKRKTNWFDFEIQNSLPEIYTGFVAAMADPTTNQALRQTIGFYRASTVSRESSIEMAIIAAHTALEAIVNFILEHRAGWSKKLMADRSIHFADKARAAAAFCHITKDILAHSPELAKRSKSSNGADAFQLITTLRNKLVHQDPRHIPRGIELVET